MLGATHEESSAGAAELGGSAYASLDELLHDDAAQAVLIATPSDTHADLAVAAADAGVGAANPHGTELKPPSRQVRQDGQI